MSFLPPTELRCLFLDLNSYFASVEQQVEPRLRGKPVIVLPLMTDSTCAIAASYEAKAFGIKTGTPVWEAKKKCPDVIMVAGRHDVYVEFHHRILEAIDHYIPVTEICSIDEVACSLDWSQRSVDAATLLARRIKQGLYDRVGECIRCSIGIAPNKFLGKVASDMMKPDGLVVLQPHELEEKLFRLNLTDLPGIASNMAERLARGGITSIEAFWRCDPKQLRRIWGSVQGERFWYVLHGYELEEFATERDSVSHSQVLAPEVRPFAEARLVGRRLTQKATSRMRRLAMAAQRFGLSVRTLDGRRWHGELSFELAHDNFTFLRSFEVLWEAAEAELRAPMLKKVGVWLAGLANPAVRQLSLFDVAAPERRRETERHERLSCLMDDLNRKFGRDTLLLGMPARKMASFTGTKVAFTRIPDREEFHE